jgi:hypothetical protein
MAWITIQIVKPGDARGWIGLGAYILVLILLLMIWADKDLLHDDFFKVIATALILTGWNQGPVGWAYQATKGGGEAAESSARIAERVTARAPSGTKENPLSVEGAGPDAEPVITERT